jgi:hypothetical protein
MEFSLAPFMFARAPIMKQRWAHFEEAEIRFRTVQEILKES